MHINKTILLLLLIFMTTAGFGQTTSPSDTIVANDKLFMRVDEEASFPGGETAWRTFLEKNLNPNVPVDNGAPLGKYTVYVQFVVDVNGNTSDVKALTNHGYGMEREVVQLIKKSGLWSPAMLNAAPVNAYRKQPVTFMVTQEDFEITSQVPYVLFTGVENEITINVHKVSSDKLNLILSGGTITMTNKGTFIARVNKPGKAILQVYTKKNKKIADVRFEVVTK
jgi:GldM C-terminal domain/Gram-negative bacterial TonB protein C-terminal